MSISAAVRGGGAGSGGGGMVAAAGHSYVVEWPKAADPVRTADEPTVVACAEEGHSHDHIAAKPVAAAVLVRSHIAVLLHSQVR